MVVRCVSCRGYVKPAAQWRSCPCRALRARLTGDNTLIVRGAAVDEGGAAISEPPSMESLPAYERRRLTLEYAMTRPAWALHDLGDWFDITRERVRQYIAEARLTDEWKAVRATHHAAQARERLYRAFAQRAKIAQPCVICGYWVLRRRKHKEWEQQFTCSPKCAYAWTILRFVIDPKAHQQHRMTVAQYMLDPNNADKYGHSLGARHRWAQRVLDQTIPEHGPRYVREGSERDRLLQELGIDFPRESEFFRDGLPWSTTSYPKTHCKHGHEKTDENVYVNKNGTRQCRECMRAAARRQYEKKKTARQAEKAAAHEAAHAARIAREAARASRV